MSETPATDNATDKELADQCQHVCLKASDHEYPHFYGYRIGPWSQAQLATEVQQLRAEKEAQEHQIGQWMSNWALSQDAERKLVKENKRLRTERTALLDTLEVAKELRFAESTSEIARTRWVFDEYLHNIEHLEETNRE